jgi:NAD(P)H-dependent FMN reductase
MKVLAFAASNSRQSINHTLVKQATRHVNGEVETIDLNDFEMPIYSVDREQASGIPPEAHSFFDKIKQADAIVVSFAEYNGSYTAAYKNLFDWTSRIDMKVYQDKPMVLLATSPGPGGAQSVLSGAVNSAPYFGMDIKGSLSVPSFFEKYDADNDIIVDQELDGELANLMTGLQS